MDNNQEMVFGAQEVFQPHIAVVEQVLPVCEHVSYLAEVKNPCVFLI